MWPLGALIPGLAVSEDRERADELAVELAAAQRTIDVLIARMERQSGAVSTDRFAIHQAMASLEGQVRHTTRELSASERYYRALFERGADPVLSVDLRGRVQTCNPAACSAFGRKGEELQGLPVASLFQADSGAALTGLLWSGFEGVGDATLRLEDHRAMSFSIARMGDDSALLVLRDITQRYRLESELDQARRLAAVGRLAAGLAEEINTPLAVIRGRLELLQTRTPTDTRRRNEQYRVLSDHARRIGDIVQNLHAFAAPRLPQRRVHLLRRAVDQALAQAGRRLERVQIEVDLRPRTLQVDADPEQLVQLLVNLLTHAAGRSPAGCPLVLEGRDAPGGGVEIRVLDEGTGLTEALLQEMRAPSAHSTGTMDPTLGLGLAISWAIAQAHSGSLTAANRALVGTSYHVHIPREEPSAGSLASPPERGLRVLVVDDDHMLRETVTWMLAELDHRIHGVASAEEALTVLQRRRFDVVLTDLRLPGMDGEELIEAIAARWPALAQRAILTSGLLHRPQNPKAYLQKPFARAQLLGLIRVVRAAAPQNDKEAGLGPTSV